MSFTPRGPRRLADLIRPTLEPVLAKRGLAQASLMLEWPDIVGARVASLCEPARLQWPPRGPKSESQGSSATLWLRVAPGRSLDVQYGAPTLIERINAHFGWRIVGKVAVASQPKRPVRLLPLPLQADPQIVARAAEMARGADHENLREALTRLGAEVLSRRAMRARSVD